MPRQIDLGDTGPTTAIHFLLDRSGSMKSVRDETIGAFNGYVETVAQENPNARLSLTIFDSQSVDTIINNVAACDVQPLTPEQYVPRAWTPLYDAIGQTVPQLSEVDADRKVLVILTDGQENGSRTFRKEQINRLLQEKQDNDNWLVIFLGANQDAFAEGATIGTVSQNTMTYDVNNMGATLRASARSTMAYASTGDRMGAAAFTDAERAAAGGPAVHLDANSINPEAAIRNLVQESVRQTRRNRRHD